MTQTYFDPPAIDYTTDSTAAGNPATTDVAKQQASEVRNHAADAGQQVAGTAKLEAQHVAGEAANQAKDLLAQTRNELTTQARSQQQRAAAGLRSLGNELQSMADHSGEHGNATGLADQAGSKVHDAASWLETREPGHLVEEVKTFARERPLAFLAIAAGAGLLAGRMTRGVKDASDETDAQSAPAASTTLAEPYNDVTPYNDVDYSVAGSTL